MMKAGDLVKMKSKRGAMFCGRIASIYVCGTEFRAVVVALDKAFEQTQHIYPLDVLELTTPEEMLHLAYETVTMYNDMLRKHLNIAAIINDVFHPPHDCHAGCVTADQCIRRPACYDPPGSL